MVRAFPVLLLLCLGCAGEDSSPRTIDVAAGDAHSCALDDRGRVRCWGRNFFGQLGDGTTEDSRVPVDVVDLPGDVVAVDAQGETTCARTGSGEVWCWGHNHHGQLGDGTIEPSPVPLRVEGSPEAVALSVGAAHVCIIDREAAVWCWGWNWPGLLGDGTNEDRLAPVRAAAGAGAVAIEAGYAVSCAIDAEARMRCWANDPLAPAEGLADVLDVAGGADHTCAVVQPGLVRCWGNQPGSFGTAIEGGLDLPLAGAAFLEAAIDHLCVGTTAGDLHCWGKNDGGQLGDNSYVARTEPVRVRLDAEVADVAVGAAHSCALTVEGALYCWGDNGRGQLGDGTEFDSLVPVRVP